MGGCGSRPVKPINDALGSFESKTKKKEEGPTSFDDALQHFFPGAIELKRFHKCIHNLGDKLGFTKENTIAMYSVCRDELTKKFAEGLEDHWGTCFDISSLGGFVFCGVTGFRAGMTHAPKQDGLERYLFFCGPHIAISADGSIGNVFREGRDKVSHACGALIGFRDELTQGKINVVDDPQDIEQTYLKQNLLEHIKFGEVPSLVDLTYRAQRCILQMVEHTLEGSVQKDTCNYLIICGILIHGPDNSNYVWVGPLKSTMKGKVTDLTDSWQKVLSEYSSNR